MWLKYGIDADKSLVSVDDVRSGKTDLTCPYCDGSLTAKKGKIKVHHFAHSGETCREVNREGEIPYLPLYDTFNINLTPKEFEKLKDLWSQYGAQDKGIYKNEVPSIFLKEKLLEFNQFRGYCQFTKLGKIPVCALSLNLFNQVQENLILEKLKALEDNALEAYLRSFPNLNQCLKDLEIYRAEFRRILLNKLYYLQVKIKNPKQIIYKIGVTQRDVEARIEEVKRDLSKHFKDFEIKILGAWEHRGNVEKYFKYKYETFNYPIGSLTEYFSFTEQEAKAVLSDLRRMKPKLLSPIDADILAGTPNKVEQLIIEQQRQEKLSEAIKRGIQSAKKWGKQLGRPSTPESVEAFLNKPTSKRIIEALDEGLSLRETAKKTGASVNTIRKVKNFLNS